MRDYQPAGVLVAASTYTKTASAELLHLSNESEGRSPISTDSQFSFLTAASSTVSIVNQTCDWPEFQENYHSIMDNTNLLDSCAEALNDINGEEGSFAVRSEKVRGELKRSLSSTTSSSLSETDNVIDVRSVELFTRWLYEMENRVAAQPKLSKIVAMKSKQMATQLEIHTKIFKEIIAQPCIVKESKRSDHKLLEERYHLLYLKVYEVLLLLEGMPINSFSSKNQFVSDSLDDTSSSTNSNEHSSDHVDNCDNEFLDDVICDNSDEDTQSPIYTETSILSTSIGTYYFNYDDEQQIDNAKLSSTILENTDKDFTFEHDLHSLLNVTDSVCVQSHDQTVDSVHRSLQQQQFTAEKIIETSKNYIWNQIDFCELVTQQPQEYCSSKEYDLIHHKVYDWLHSKTQSHKSESSASLDYYLTTSEADYQLLYRAKSEMDLSFCRPLNAANRASSLRTSVNCLASILSPVKHFEQSLNDSIPEECSLIWDNFELGNEFIKSDSDYGFAGSDLETKDQIDKLCYFGDDYSMHLNESISSTDSEQELDFTMKPKNVENNVKKLLSNVTDAPSSTTTSSPYSESVKVRRSRRIRNKCLRKHSSVAKTDSTLSNSNSILSLDQSSDAYFSEATTVNATVDDSSAHDALVPEQTISYNSEEKQFEVHTNESIQPKKMKINEMRPDDFYDIVKMCQSNIDCVITVLGADPNRILTVSYCQQMKYERYQKSNDNTCKCKQPQYIEHEPTPMDPKCNCHGHIKTTKSTCVCGSVSHAIAMILNFLIDCWNIFRNMKLYTYLCRVTKALFGSTRYVADHLSKKRDIVNAKAIKYS